MLKQKCVLLGVSGSIAIYKAASLCSALKKQGADVHVLMTENATKMMSPVIFEQLTGNRACVDTFDRNFPWQVEHVALAKKADLLLVAPATANVCAKLAHGIADDMLTTTALACTCPKLIAPAMNTRMYENPVTQENLKTLTRFGWEVITPASGYLACGDTGAGKLPEPETLLAHIIHTLAYPHDMQGLRVLVTAGPTREAIDPVRYLTNRSTGKMGYAIARAAAGRGAKVTLVSGPTALSAPLFVETVPVESADDMFREVTTRAENADLIIKAAAVADYRPVTVADDKIKKNDGDMAIPLTRTRDILGYLGQHRRPGQVLCGFSMETKDMLNNSRRKLEKKNLDLIAANNVKVPGAGFAVDTNVLTLITRQGEEELPLLSKDEAAHRLLDALLRLKNKTK
ncbi:MAG TPA: bifunctional phosphopantothenoylcysteine decarboxylase/phosphopantothenate--cysteine ligase CoaBC [Firmicutes bacterium]|nr:bifunctional phosphopantothenoylcysteine decarboxylase/phosphopantothenate--cysteine ligase CoaBC [Bacillota bacterium]